MNGDGPEQWTLATLAAAICAKEISPVDITRAYLDRVDELNGTLNAFITVLHKEALSEARNAEREILKGRYLGPLHGIPYGAKDLYLTRGIRTTCGSRILADFVPSEDADLIARLKRAGAVLLGKMNLHEFAFGVTSENPHYGAVRNPWDTSRIAGGSSGGSAAAVASSLVTFALGTDTGGSIRIPSALCGIAGLKPTYGRLSRRGIYPLGWSLDHPGPMAKTAADLAIAMSVLANDASDLASGLRADLEGVRIGVPDAYFFERVDSGVETHVRRALSCMRRLGAVVRPVSVPLLREGAAAAAITLFAEAASSLEKWHRTRAVDLGPDVRARLDLGATVTARQYLKAQRIRAKVRRAFSEVFQGVDALITPELPITAPVIGEREVSIGRTREAVPDALTRLTRIFNLVGIPSLTVCCGFSRIGLPIGLQISAAANRELTALRIGHAFERSAQVAATPTMTRAG